MKLETAEAQVGWLLAEMHKVATLERAEYEKAYQKSELDFLGVTVPQTRIIAKGFLKVISVNDKHSLWNTVDSLWKLQVWEMRTVAMILLETKHKFLSVDDLDRLQEMVIEASCWAFNDWIGCHIVGSIVDRQSEGLAIMDKWAKHSDLWVRRVAMQSLLVPMRGGNLEQWERFTRYAEPLASERDFWTRKVIGWICREVSKHSPDPVFDFLYRNRDILSGLSLREGAKYMSEDRKAQLGLSKAKN